MPVTNTRALYFPYCLQQLDDKSWIILNRNYKPLGSATEEHVTYEDIDPKMRIAKIASAQARLLAYSGDADAEGRIYLYQDGCIPTDSEKNMTAYLKRLSVLMKLKLKKTER
jgi:hypothetical protein